jgi:hypothetical protein
MRAKRSGGPGSPLTEVEATMTNKMPEPPRYVWPASATAPTRTAARAARPDWDRGGVMSGTVYLLHFGRAYVSANGWAWPSTYVGWAAALGRAGISYRARPRALAVSLRHCESVDVHRFAG